MWAVDNGDGRGGFCNHDSSVIPAIAIAIVIAIVIVAFVATVIFAQLYRDGLVTFENPVVACYVNGYGCFRLLRTEGNVARQGRVVVPRRSTACYGVVDGDW